MHAIALASVTWGGSRGWGARGSVEVRRRGLLSKHSEGMGREVCIALLILPKSHTRWWVWYEVVRSRCCSLRA